MILNFLIPVATIIAMIVLVWHTQKKQQEKEDEFQKKVDEIHDRNVYLNHEKFCTDKFCTEHSCRFSMSLIAVRMGKEWGKCQIISRGANGAMLLYNPDKDELIGYFRNEFHRLKNPSTKDLVLFEDTQCIGVRFPKTNLSFWSTFNVLWAVDDCILKQGRPVPPPAPHKNKTTLKKSHLRVVK